MSKYSECPRCGSESFERLSDYVHCPNCLYFEDYYEDTETCYSAARSLEISHMNPSCEQDDEELDDAEEQLAS